MTVLLSAPQVSPAADACRDQSGSVSLQTPRLSIVIVNYCQWDNTTELVEQICQTDHADAHQVEVVVVDNHSPPSRLMRRLRQRRGVSLRRWGRNRGFARAVNEGARLSEGNWLLLLNPDITIDDRFLTGVLGLCEELEDDARAGIVGFQLHNGDGTPQHSWGPFPSLAGTLLRMLLPRARRKYALLGDSQRRAVPWVTGCCLLIRRTCLQELAGLDDQYFLYYEDVDLCRRAQAHGWSVSFEPKLRAVHHHPLHSRKVPAVLRLITRHSLLTYAAQHWPRWQMRCLARIVGLEARVRRLWARLRRDEAAAQVFSDLKELAIAFRKNDEKAVRTRLRRVLRKQENDLAGYADC